MVVKVVGKDPQVAKKITCKNCSSILEYLPKDVKFRTYNTMGEMETDSYIKCPSCKQIVIVRE